MERVQELPCCVGVDLAWWGGSRRDKTSQRDTVIATDFESDALTIRVVDLSQAPNPASISNHGQPNFDADGSLLALELAAILKVSPHQEAILCLDAPLEARRRDDQLARCRSIRKGERTGYCQRQAEAELGAARRSVPDAFRPWNPALKIQPGSPLFPRIEALVDRLRTCGQCELAPFRTGHDRLRGLVEVFPSEAIWALGIRGDYESSTPHQVRRYKAKKLSPSLADAAEIAALPLRGFTRMLASSGIEPGRLDAWIQQIADHAVSVGLRRKADGSLGTNKCFDDTIESGIAFLTAVACAVGQVHLWGDGSDGTIVGPGHLVPAFCEGDRSAILRDWKN